MYLKKGTQILTASMLLLGTAVEADAPDMPAGMADLLRRKYDVVQQQADTDRLRAEAQVATSNASQAQSHSEDPVQWLPHRRMAVGGGEPLAGTDAATYKLNNGVIMRVSGILLPSDSATCIEHCP